ncbi:MAG: hypothetical protein R2911_15340 [Caldilineaceae bacterium]
MSTVQIPVHAMDADGRWLFRVGGLSALAIGVAYMVIIALYAQVGAPPIGGQAWLDYLAGKTTLWWAIIDISILTNFLFVPVALALFAALKQVNRNAMLIAVGFVGLFVVLELAVNWSSYAALVMLSVDYAAAANDAQRAVYIAAASYPSAVLASPLALIYAIGTLSFGFLIIGYVMLKGLFNKITAYVGIITGILGIVAVAGWSIAVILNAIFATIWLLLVGYRLYRLAG